MSARYRPHDDVIHRSIEQQAVLLDLKTGEYFGLNETGARIWDLLEQHDSGEIAAKLSEEYDVSADEARAAVDALIADLLGRRLIEPVEAGGSTS